MTLLIAPLPSCHGRFRPYRMRLLVSKPALWPISIVSDVFHSQTFVYSHCNSAMPPSIIFGQNEPRPLNPRNFLSMTHEVVDGCHACVGLWANMTTVCHIPGVWAPRFVITHALPLSMLPLSLFFFPKLHPDRKIGDGRFCQLIASLCLRKIEIQITGTLFACDV